MVDLKKPNDHLSPYAAPTADMSEYDDFEEYNTEPFYSKSGRIGRLRFLAYSIMLGVSSLVLGGIGFAFISLENAFGAIVGLIFLIPALIAMIYAQFAPAMRRFNDLDKSGWYALLLLIPYLGFLVWLYLIFKSGNEGMNDYGAPAEPPTKSITIIALIIPVFIPLVGILAAIILPAFSR